MQLTKNFTLEELTKSETAIRLGIENIPNNVETNNLKNLCENVLQPIRNHFGLPVVVSSGFRSLLLNTKIGGASTSQHMKGQAADFTISGISLETIYFFIKESLNYDQLIYEFGHWIHVSFNSWNNRKQNLIAEKVNGRIAYKAFEGKFLMSVLDFLGNTAESIGSFLTGGLSDKIIDAVKVFFPASMSELEKAELQLRIKDAAHKQEIELLQLLNESEKEFNKRTIDLEGTANDLKSIPIIGAVVIFLRGAFRPITSYIVVYMAFMSLSGAWSLTDKQDSLLWVMVVLVLGFFFGERAMKNVMPIIGQYFGSKNK